VCANEIVVLMAGAAFFRGYTVALRATPHVHGVGMAIISLPGEISSRMTIHAARMAQNRDEGGE
jgi:hypothetical protein